MKKRRQLLICIYWLLFIIFLVLTIKTLLSEFSSHLILDVIIVLLLIFLIINHYKKLMQAKLLNYTIDALEESIIILDYKDRIYSVNQAYLSQNGLDLKEVIGKKAQQVLKCEFENIHNHLNVNGYYEGEYLEQSTQGINVHKYVKVFKVKNALNKNPFIIIIVSNIDSIKRLEVEKSFSDFYTNTTMLPNEKSLIRDFNDNKFGSNFNVITCLINNDLEIISKFSQQVLYQSIMQLEKYYEHETNVNIYHTTKERLVFITTKKYDVFVQDLLKKASNIDVDGKNIMLNIKLGISTYPEQGKDVANLLNKAHLALNTITLKEKTYAIYDENLENKFAHEETIKRDLISAMENNEIDIYYHPQIDSSINKVIGVEALARWFNSNYGFITPLHFFEIAKKNGLLEQLNKYLINRIFMDIEKILNCNNKLTLSINVNASTLESEDFYEFVYNKLSNKSCIAERIMIELTESEKVQKLEDLVKIISKYKKLGFKISIDDYGTGYNALKILKSIPFDEIKIDREFIKELTISNDYSIVKSIIDLGKSLSLSVVAEGVEKQEEIDILNSLDCYIIQGYFYTKPLPLVDLVEYLKNYN